MFLSKHRHAYSTACGVSVESVNEESPKFERVYTKKLDNRASVKVTAKTFLCSRLYSGELTQPNGRWILFDPKEIADKVLDTMLVPLVQGFVGSCYGARYRLYEM